MSAILNRAGRRGTVLILVAGMSAVLAAMTVAFLTRMRSDVSESQRLLQEIQARCALSAALMYVAETARLGWDDPATAVKEEAFGWIDVRDGTPGPKDQAGRPLAPGGAFPAIGYAARCPMHVMRRPPFAISLAVTANPMIADPSKTWAEILGNTRTDPDPVAATLAGFSTGDAGPRFPGGARTWFRVHRETPATFVLACGAGMSLGYRDWTEVALAGDDAVFGTRAAFEELRRDEAILWFRAEWNPAVGYNAQYHYAADRTFRLNRISGPHMGGNDDIPNSRQFGGTFTVIERLRDAPPAW
ncbi:MAG TPA: hypothetical protein VEL07_20340 [Planctomycetota bacterium]|nr:hypothetical protein [Planctomycetota bacterium]